MYCYVLFFQYIVNHDNSIAASVLHPAVVKRRNRANAITMVGLMATWLMEIW
jgi:hypothetical protein